MKFEKDILKQFQNAIYKDYGVFLEDEELEEAAYKLFRFIQVLIKFDKEGNMFKQVLKKSERLS